jgi:hypothetical protein
MANLNACPCNEFLNENNVSTKPTSLSILEMSAALNRAVRPIHISHPEETVVGARLMTLAECQRDHSDRRRDR